MSTKTQVNVDIITEVKGLQNLKKGEQQVNLFGEAAKKLGAVFAATFATDKIIAFGKASIAAFAKNEKEIAILTNTLKNLGLGFDSLAVNDFIDHLALATGRTKEELIPAFQGLVVATGSVSKAQDALKVAMDVSAATGKDLSKVQIALSKGFLGNTTSLTRLGAGLDKATLATGDMNLIMAKLSATFGGSATTAVNTFQGKLDKLNVALIEAKVNIGTGLVEAFTSLAGGGSVDKATSKMLTFSKVVGELIAFMGGAKQGILANEISFKFGIIPQIKPGIVLDKYPAQQSPGARAAAVAAELKAAQAKLKLDQASAKALAEQKKAVADKLALERSSLSLKLAGSTADLQNIEIQAALQRGQTEQVNNVLLLQRALINGNADQASLLAQEVLKANGLVMDVDGNISALSKAKNPFADWPTASAAAVAQLKAIQDALNALKNKTITVTVNTVNAATGATSSSSSGTNSFNVNSTIPVGDYVKPVTYTPDLSVAAATEFADAAAARAQAMADALDAQIAADLEAYNNSAAVKSGAMKPIVINITAPKDTVIDTTQDASTNGTTVTVNRTNPFGLYSV